MKDKLKKSFFIVPLAIVLVLLLILGSLFRIETFESESAFETPVNFISLLPQNTQSKFLMERVARDEFDDPTIMSLPNQKVGFSIVLKNEGEPPQPALPEYNIILPTIPDIEQERVPLVGVYEEPDSKGISSMIKPDLPTIELEHGNKTYTKRIVWLEDGKEKLCPIDLQNAMKSANGRVPGNKTRIKFKKLSESYIYFLVEKCGVAELDDLVVEYIQNKLKELYVGNLAYKDMPDEITVDWRLVITSVKSQ